MVICIDADWTIFKNDENYRIIGVLPGAVEFINRLYDDGNIIIIWSSRNSLIVNLDDIRKNLEELRYNLDRYGIKYDWIDDGRHGKIPADVYIDDKAIRFEGWDELIYNKIQDIKTNLGDNTFDSVYIEFFNRYDGNLEEATIRELLNDASKDKRELAKDRFVKFEEFDDNFVWFTAKGGERDYAVVIELLDFWKVLEDEKYRTFLDKARAILKGDVNVYCECPSFLYHGFQYIATRDRFIIGGYEEHRRPDITNPNLEGTVCKHLIVALQALPFYASDLAGYLKSIFGDKDSKKSRK
jgi:hypothetical protein